MPSFHSSWVVHIHHKINLFLVSTGASLFTLIMVQIGLLKKMLQEGLWKKETPEWFLFSPKSLKTEVCLSSVLLPDLPTLSDSYQEVNEKTLPFLCPSSTSLLWWRKKPTNQKNPTNKKAYKKTKQTKPHNKKKHPPKNICASQKATITEKVQRLLPIPWYFP